MLSLGKLATGQAGYYLEQAQGSLSRIRSVSSGVEDYYLGGPEAAGEWLGDGAARLGLTGRVEAADLRAILEGRHPHTGTEPTHSAQERSRSLEPGLPPATTSTI